MRVFLRTHQDFGDCLEIPFTNTEVLPAYDRAMNLLRSLYSKYKMCFSKCIESAPSASKIYTGYVHANGLVQVNDHYILCLHHKCSHTDTISGEPIQAVAWQFCGLCIYSFSKY